MSIPPHVATGPTDRPEALTTELETSNLNMIVTKQCMVFIKEKQKEWFRNF